MIATTQIQSFSPENVFSLLQEILDSDSYLKSPPIKGDLIQNVLFTN